MDNYLELEIGDALSEIHDVVNDPPGSLPGEIQAGADQDWSARINEAIEKFRGLVERRTKYVTVRWLIDKTCHRCAAGEERNEKGQHAISEREAPRCLASGLWEEVAKLEKENTDAV